MLGAAEILAQQELQGVTHGGSLGKIVQLAEGEEQGDMLALQAAHGLGDGEIALAGELGAQAGSAAGGGLAAAKG